MTLAFLAPVYLWTKAFHVISMVAWMASLFYLLDIPPSRLFFLYFWLLDLGVLMGFHALVRRIQRLARARGYDTRNVVVVGAGPTGHAVVAAIKNHAWSGLRIVGIVDDAEAVTPDGAPAPDVYGVPLIASVECLPRLLEKGGIDEVVIALPASAHETLVWLSREVQRFPVMVKVAPDVLDVFLLRSTVTDLWGLPLLSVREPAITGVRWFFKRALDVALAALLLLVLAPLMACIALAVRLSSRGPILLRQQRVGDAVDGARDTGSSLRGVRACGLRSHRCLRSVTDGPESPPSVLCRSRGATDRGKHTRATSMMCRAGAGCLAVGFRAIISNDQHTTCLS